MHSSTRPELQHCAVLDHLGPPRYHDKTFTTKRSLRNGSRRMAHDECLGVRFGEPFVVNHIALTICVDRFVCELFVLDPSFTSSNAIYGVPATTGCHLVTVEYGCSVCLSM